MKTLPRFLLLLLGPLCLAEAQEVVSPAKRQASISAAEQLLSTKDTGLPAGTINPFRPEAFAEAVAGTGRAGVASPGTETTGTTVAHPAGPRTERDILAAIAAVLKPSGYFVFGGQPTLVFGQKRVKAGGPLTITFEGTEYTLEVTAINRTNFTLRLNREEFTRPIK
ncbi:MAG: hypothetical protein HYV95_03845 [Opitutae bacterium]|nr:hypothetical protein [Opitutae bacterium]